MQTAEMIKKTVMNTCFTSAILRVTKEEYSLPPHDFNVYFKNLITIKAPCHVLLQCYIFQIAYRYYQSNNS